jgi:hypothetical protein
MPAAGGDTAGHPPIQCLKRPDLAEVEDRFDAETLALLDRTEEVTIETRSRSGRGHETIIWVVVAEGGDVYVRSVRGTSGRWYGELMETQQGALHAGERRIGVRAIPAPDELSIEACNEALRRKYTGIPGFEPMFEEHTLPTTVRLVPA